jgi:hypothetical protein
MPADTSVSSLHLRAASARLAGMTAKAAPFFFNEPAMATERVGRSGFSAGLTLHFHNHPTMPALKSVSPFPKAHRTRVGESHVDVDMLKIERNKPLPAAVRQSSSKYDALFQQMKPGDCVVCEFNERGKVVSALLKFIAKNGLACRTKSLGRCDDGRARVWLLAK